MKWTEITVVTNHAGAEFVAELLTDELGTKGVVIDDAALVNRYIDAGVWDYTSLTKNTDENVVTVTAYLPTNGTEKEKILLLNKRLAEADITDANLIEAKIICREFADEDWSETWKQYFHVTRTGKKFVIKPTWENYSPQSGDIVLEIDPGLAFGTGTHPTTALCLRALETLPVAGKTVFDVGTGSGILATAAAKLGAAGVRATDNDETALNVARGNAAQNGVAQKIDFAVDDLLTDAPGTADLIIANIVADIIIRLLPDAAKHLNANGILLVSGIIDDREAEILKTAGQCGFVCRRVTAEKEWRAMVFALRAEGQA